MEQSALEQIYREEWGKIVATLIRLLGSFDLAEEAAQEAFAVALGQWPRQGVPANPRAWLISTARNKAIDRLRRKARWEDDGDPYASLTALEQQPAPEVAEDALAVEDDRLRLIFTCCHPALAAEAQVALTLRTLCGFTTEQIAKAFLVPLATMAQRLVRAKQKIRDAGIPYRTPPREELAERLAAVLLVVYLVFNEGYNAAAGGRELCAEAIRLGRLLTELLPDEAEARGLLALMLLHAARREARTDKDGDLILLEDQDRRLWKHAEIGEGLALAESALRRAPGPYSVQAAIAAVHANALYAWQTDWAQIVALYDVLLSMQPSPVIELNRAAAVAMAKGCEEGLRLVDGLEQRGELRGYYLLPAARADMLRRLGRWGSAAQAYRAALAIVAQEAERRFLAGRLAEVEALAG
ncbi:MAG TPA: sigma-70 family RNA polymerase sigma factor [Terracidiphilus sp.]|jgi:RNA polymerase sigma-70 factor (ECF subfamily)